MAQFTFEGEIEFLADPQIKLVESVLQKRGFKDGKVQVEQVGQKGDNYVAHVKRFMYEAKDGATFKMIGKIAPVSEELRMAMSTMLLFNNEITMYNEVLPKLNDIQNSADITEDEKVRFPICYGAVTEAPFEFILLEDLTESGFEMLDRFQPLSNENVRLVIKDLARFHSLSYVLKHSEPETYKNVTGKFYNIWAMIADDPQAKQFLEMAENDIMMLMYDSSEKYKKALTGSLSQLTAVAKKIESYEKSSKYSVIQHGDCWNNNILFRLVVNHLTSMWRSMPKGSLWEDGKAVQDVMIDYQVSKESNPAADILYMLLNCTNYTLRQKHYQEWIDYYHEVLDDSLNSHGLKANRIFPKDQLDADLRRYGRAMVNSSVMLASILVRESKDVVDFKDMTGGESGNLLEETMAQMNMSSLDATTIMKLKERIMGVIGTGLEFGLLSL